MEHRQGASLSLAPHHNCRWARAGRGDGYYRAHDGRANESSLGQPVIVENVIGAAGTIAVGRVARAAPDGYMLSIGSNASYVMAGAIYALQYDLLNGFAPVALLSTSTAERKLRLCLTRRYEDAPSEGRLR